MASAIRTARKLIDTFADRESESYDMADLISGEWGGISYIHDRLYNQFKLQLDKLGVTVADVIAELRKIIRVESCRDGKLYGNAPLSYYQLGWLLSDGEDYDND